MRLIGLTMSCLILAAPSLTALDKEFAGQMMQSAQKLRKDASEIKLSLKSKTIDDSKVTQKIDEMAADVTKLQDLVRRFDETKPQMNTADQAAWTLVKQKVQIIEIFHGQKKVMASEGVTKNRARISQLASGVAVRAQKLEQSTMKLSRT